MDYKRPVNVVSAIAAVFCLSVIVSAETVTLKAAKDTFCRSNSRNRNSGAHPVLYVAHAPSVRTLIAFDLSDVTNRITSATFRFRVGNDNPNSVALTVAPMAQTEANAAWTEGQGTLGTTGQNARAGESCYGWSAFPDQPWEDASEKPVTDLGHARLWERPVVSGKRQEWINGAWAEIAITDAALLEKIRNSSAPVVTLGIWGTSGNGLYALGSRESGHAPELVVVLEDDSK